MSLHYNVLASTSTSEIQMTISEHDAWYKGFEIWVFTRKCIPLGCSGPVRFVDHDNEAVTKTKNPLRALVFCDMTAILLCDTKCHEFSGKVYMTGGSVSALR
jgi:hypothetical protein